MSELFYFNLNIQTKELLSFTNKNNKPRENVTLVRIQEYFESVFMYSRFVMKANSLCSQNDNHRIGVYAFMRQILFQLYHRSCFIRKFQLAESYRLPTGTYLRKYVRTSLPVKYMRACTRLDHTKRKPKHKNAHYDSKLRVFYLF